MKKNAKILLIGGSGFIGTCLCSAIRAKGYVPVVYDWVPPPLDDTEYFQGDISTLVDNFPAILQGVELIYHLAWSTKPASANLAPLDDLQQNVLAGVNFLDVLVKQDNVPRVVFASSGGAVYGDVDILPVSEEYPTKPIGAYGISKLTFEYYLQLYNQLHGLDYLIFRPANPYGPNYNSDNSQGAIGVFLRKLMKKEMIEIWGDGGVIRDYLYIDDLVSGFMTAIDYNPGKQGRRIFNLGSGIGVSLKELIYKLEEISGVKADVEYLPSRGFDVKEIVLSGDNAYSTLGWKCGINLEEGIRKTWDWLIKNEQNIQ